MFLMQKSALPENHLSMIPEKIRRVNSMNFLMDDMSENYELLFVSFIQMALKYPLSHDLMTS